MKSPRAGQHGFDRELTDMPAALRWREWMMRVETVLFAAPRPVDRGVLARVVGPDCPIDSLIDDVRAELAGRPYEIVEVAGGWQFRTRPGRGDVVDEALGPAKAPVSRMSQTDMLVLATIAYHQPVSRKTIAEILGRDIGRDGFARLRAMEMIGLGPRAPEPGSPYTYVTTEAFLTHFGLFSLGELPQIDAIYDTGLLSDADFPDPMHSESEDDVDF